jgi:hypothetical protein
MDAKKPRQYDYLCVQIIKSACPIASVEVHLNMIEAGEFIPGLF